MRNFVSALAALCLCGALLAGCAGDDGGMAGSGSAAVSGAQSGTAADSTSMAPSASPDAGAVSGSGMGETGSTAYTAEGLNTVLGGLVTYSGDTAGGSLKAASAAGELVNFAATAGDGSATLGADAKAWLDTLTDEQKEMLRTNWKTVRDTANGIATDLENQTGLLADAGVTYDFANMDMSGVSAFMNTLDSVLGAY